MSISTQPNTNQILELISGNGRWFFKQLTDLHICPRDDGDDDDHHYQYFKPFLVIIRSPEIKSTFSKLSATIILLDDEKDENFRVKLKDNLLSDSQCCLLLSLMAKEMMNRNLLSSECQVQAQCTLEDLQTIKEEIKNKGFANDIKLSYTIGCDLCGMRPIAGKIMHCKECSNIDLCESCSLKPLEVPISLGKDIHTSLHTLELRVDMPAMAAVPIS